MRVCLGTVVLVTPELDTADLYTFREICRRLFILYQNINPLDTLTRILVDTNNIEKYDRMLWKSSFKQWVIDQPDQIIHPLIPATHNPAHQWESELWSILRTMLLGEGRGEISDYG